MVCGCWGWVLVLVLAVVEANKWKHNSDHVPRVQGANFLLVSRPSGSGNKARELERRTPPTPAATILEVECDGKKFAGYNVGEHEFTKFVGISCSSDKMGAIAKHANDFTPETTKYLHALWKSHRLMTPSHAPGQHLQDVGDDMFALELAATSHSIQRVLDTVEAEGGKHHMISAMQRALGEDVLSLKHPSREAAQEVLHRIKKNFNFFHGDKCLVSSVDGKDCGELARPIGASSCNDEESQHMCTYTEIYTCPQCGATFRFPRYRSVPKILETKLGRCGEFSDAALTVFDTLGYDSRLVVDHTDHVWVELDLEGRGHDVMTHADPSEGILDEPFLYEDNWKKQLTFVFAHTPDSVEDRSNTYWHSDKHQELVSRRGMADTQLNHAVFDANMELESDIPDKANDTDGGEKNSKDLERESGHSAMWWQQVMEESKGSFRTSKATRDLESLVNELDLVTSGLEVDMKN